MAHHEEGEALTHTGKASKVWLSIPRMSFFEFLRPEIHVPRPFFLGFGELF